MDLSLTDEQQQLTEAFARLYEHHATPERVREAEPGGFDKALWERPGDYVLTLSYGPREYEFTPLSRSSLEPLFRE